MVSHNRIKFHSNKGKENASERKYLQWSWVVLENSFACKTHRGKICLLSTQKVKYIFVEKKKGESHTALDQTLVVSFNVICFATEL